MHKNISGGNVQSGADPGAQYVPLEHCGEPLLLEEELELDDELDELLLELPPDELDEDELLLELEELDEDELLLDDDELEEELLLELEELPLDELLLDVDDCPGVGQPFAKASISNGDSALL